MSNNILGMYHNGILQTKENAKYDDADPIHKFCFNVLYKFLEDRKNNLLFWEKSTDFITLYLNYDEVNYCETKKEKRYFSEREITVEKTIPKSEYKVRLQLNYNFLSTLIEYIKALKSTKKIPDSFYFELK